MPLDDLALSSAEPPIYGIPLPDNFKMGDVLKSHDVLMITLDTLRYDIAQEEYVAGRLPGFSALLPNSGWEKRHSPGSFTFAAHQAFFAGFLPTPAHPNNSKQMEKPRLFASKFDGSRSTGSNTWVFDQADVVSALAAEGFHTLCIGGVGFFNPSNALGRVLPGLFQESQWHSRFSVLHPKSTENQVRFACKRLRELHGRVFTFINISAMHHPNNMYLPEGKGSPKSRSADRFGTDTAEGHAAALRYVDEALKPLWWTVHDRAPTLVILCSDHGTAYGDDGYYGHRLAHESVWNVPYAEFLL